MANDRYTAAPPADLIPAWRAVFERQKAFAEHAMGQLPDELFFRAPAEGMNSVAVIARHVGGNLRSRFTDFLTTDGEKPWRDRESEFAAPEATGEGRAVAMAEWERGWGVLFGALDGLTPADLTRVVTIRSVPHGVHAAVARAMDHTAYHVGQITVIARLLAGSDGWTWFTIPPGGTGEFNRGLMGKERGPTTEGTESTE